MAELNFTENAFILGEGVMFIGTIEAPGVANINGTVKGDIKAADIKIGPKGEVSGQVEAHLIDVRGQLAETIVCHEHILIHRHGCVSGNLNYLNIEIERGGKFSGKLAQKTGSEAMSSPTDSLATE
jgi:cytoskeletal protein CcmA (bactofilin family)